MNTWDLGQDSLFLLNILNMFIFQVLKILQSPDYVKV